MKNIFLAALLLMAACSRNEARDNSSAAQAATDTGTHADAITEDADTLAQPVFPASAIKIVLYYFVSSSSE